LEQRLALHSHLPFFASRGRALVLLGLLLSLAGTLSAQIIDPSSSNRPQQGDPDFDSRENKPSTPPRPSGIRT